MAVTCRKYQEKGLTIMGYLRKKFDEAAVYYKK